MKIEIELEEFDPVGKTGKTLKLWPGSIESDVVLEICTHGNRQGIIICDIKELIKALDKIAL